MYGIQKCRIDQGRLSRLLRLRGGIVERNLARRRSKVAGIAQDLAPGPMPEYIDWHIEEGPRGLQCVITCDHPATLFVLNGTRPHIIRPRRAKALRFEVDGQVVCLKIVRHPGTSRTTSWPAHFASGADGPAIDLLYLIFADPQSGKSPARGVRLLCKSTTF